ncbi:hypothetical protein [Agarivorans sp. QJM3NY_33]|uniref:hypothetical protein n=1 Tax=Agarivorans sp. QJM3NY_33 TaxID=3421432 RepID=UPI003D7E9E06
MTFTLQLPKVSLGATLYIVSFLSQACELQAIPPAQVQRGCGCSYYFPAKPPLPPKIVLQTQLDGLQPRMMREGQLVELWGAKARPLYTQPGWVSEQKFRYQATSIKLYSELRRGCTWGEAGCEVLGYLSQLAMADNYQQCQWLVQGDCGC